MPIAGNLHALAGQTYHLLPVSLSGYISSRRSNCGKIVNHRLSIDILDDNYLYGEWRKGVKDQMLAWGFRKVPTFPDHHFQEIVADMRTLRPACNSLVKASAANNRAGMPLIDEAVVQLCKDCGVKLRTTVKNSSTGLAPLCQNGVLYNQIMLSDRLLPPNTPDQWGPATPVPNPGPVPQNVPLAYLPLVQNIPAYHGNYLPPAQGVETQCVAAQGLSAQNVPNHRGNYLPQAQSVAAQGVAVQGVAVQGVAAQGVLVQNVPAHHGNYLPPAQGVPAQNIRDNEGNYPPPMQNVPAHPAIYLLLVKTYRAILRITLFLLKTHLPFPPISLFLIHLDMVLL